VAANSETERRYEMRSRFFKGTLAVLAIIAIAGLSPVAASAATFNYSAVGGFYFNAGDPLDPLNPTQGNGTTGGLELFGPVAATTGLPPGTAPANTYRDIGWGCGSGNTNCAAAGTNVVGTSPFDGPNAGDRSALRVDTVRGSLEPVIPGVPAVLPAIWVGPLTGSAAAFAANPADGTITSDGNWVFLSHILHDNSAISDTSINLVDAIVRTNLRISSNPQFDDLDSDVNINFEETINDAPCANDVGPDCADRFTFTVNTFAPVIITDNGIDYLLEFDLFTDDPNIVIIGNTVWTGEGDINDLWVIMRLTQITVPLPGSLLLLGVGGLLVGVARYRRAGRK
jgi:hypothetical protein